MTSLPTMARIPWLTCLTCAGGGPGTFCPGIWAEAINAPVKKRDRMKVTSKGERPELKIPVFGSMLDLNFLSTRTGFARIKDYGREASIPVLLGTGGMLAT